MNPSVLNHSRRLRAMPVLAAGALLVALALPAASRADTYVINDGPSTPSANASAGPWTAYGGPQGNKSTWSLTAGDYIGPLGATMAQSTSDGVRASSPAGSGITIREAKLWWYAPRSVSGNNVTVFAGTNTGNVFSLSGGGVNRLSTPDDFTLAANSTVLQLWTYCTSDNQAASCTMGPDSTPDLELAGSQLTLNDPGVPTGSVTGGSLADPGTVAGSQSLSYQATDSASGVRMVQLLVDGQVVSQADYLPQCPYDNFLACPASVSGSLSWNTATVTDGAHDVALKVINPSNNVAVVDEHTVTTVNAPTFTAPPTISGGGVVGQTLTAASGSMNSDAAAGTVATGGQWLSCDATGVNCAPIAGANGPSYTVAASDASHTIRYRESATNDDGSSTADSDAAGPVTAPATDGGTTDGGTADGGTTGGGTTGDGTTGETATGGGTTEPVTGGGDGGGDGTGGSGGTGTPPGVTITAPVVTAPGAPPARPVADPLGTTLMWHVMLAVAPLRRLRATDIVLTGRVSTEPQPSSGKLVYLQVRRKRIVRRNRRRTIVFSSWATFDATRANALGMFKATYRFAPGGSPVYQFRAVAPRERGYRNRTGNSAIVTVSAS